MKRLWWILLCVFAVSAAGWAQDFPSVTKTQPVATLKVPMKAVSARIRKIEPTSVQRSPSTTATKGSVSAARHATIGIDNATTIERAL